jgi:hypothetical protein
MEEKAHELLKITRGWYTNDANNDFNYNNYTVWQQY